MSSSGKLKILLGLLVFVLIIIGGYGVYLYRTGGVENYRPPADASGSINTQVLSNLTALSQAIDAYHVKNLKYPERLEQLKPEFMDEIPMEPGTGKPFAYQSDGSDQYQIVVSNPNLYGLKELLIKNGKIIQN
jgi:hypothetical protein